MQTKLVSQQEATILTIYGALLRFLLVYPALIVSATFVVSYFEIKSTSGISFVILAGSVAWICEAFGKKNKRYFSGREKAIVVLGFSAISIFVELILGVFSLIQAPVRLSLNDILIALCIIAFLHAALIYYIVVLSKKSLIKKGLVDD